MMLGSANLVSQWFSRRRGFAMSLMALGFALSMAVHHGLPDPDPADARRVLV